MRSSSLQKAPAFRAALVLALAVALAAMVAAAQANPARAAFPGENGKIAFDSEANVNGQNPTGDSEIFTTEPDGTGLTQLTFNESDDAQPDFSPDGDKIAFTSKGTPDNNPEGDFEIYTINADGTGLTNVTNNSANVLDIDSDPAFSPDGTKIAFDSSGDATNNPDGNGEIFTINADGTGLTNVTNDGANVLDNAPDWSSTDKIAYERVDESVTPLADIFTINPDGTEPFNVTNDTSVENRNPDWSPDGASIVFDIDPNPGVNNPEVHTINADGTGLTQLTADDLLDSDQPAFSPDGNQIAFIRETSGPTADPLNPDGEPEVFTMNADGTGQEVNVTNNAVPDDDPDWQPEQNQPPVANDDAFSVDEDQTLTVDPPGVLLNDDDPDGDPLTAGLVSGPANGTLTLDPDGSFAYEPDANFNGTDSFTYEATDGAGGSDTATATIEVRPVDEQQPPSKHKKKHKKKKGKGKKGKHGKGGGGGISQGY